MPLRKGLVELGSYDEYSRFYQRWKRSQADYRGLFEVEYPVFIGVDLAKPGSDQTVASAVDPYAAIAEHIYADAEKHRNEHIWDMIVLAAKSSRYE